MAEVLSLPTKRCGALGHKGERDLPISAFYRNRSAPDGRAAYCSTCEKARVSARREGTSSLGLLHRVQKASPPPESEPDDEDSSGSEELDQLTQRGSLTQKDQAEVERFTNRALELVLAGVPWAQAWDRANRDEDDGPANVGNLLELHATKLRKSPHALGTILYGPDLDPPGYRIGETKGWTPPLVTPPARLQPVREAQVEHFAAAGEQRTRAGFRDAFQDAAAILNEPEDVDAHVDEPEDFEGAGTQPPSRSDVGTRGRPGKLATPPLSTLDPLAKTLLAFLEGGPLSTNDLAWDLGEPPVDIEAALVLLEAARRVKRSAGKWRPA